jgi:flagellar basal-body rod protein FlgB
MNAVPKYDALVFNEAALKLRTRRQEILTNNLANSDTPGFKARDIDTGYHPSGSYCYSASGR